MNSLGTLDASAGDQLKLAATHKKSAVFEGVLRAVDAAGNGEDVATWDRSTLEGAGGTATLQNVDHYDVIIIPQIDDGASITATLTVGDQTSTKTITTNASAGWTINID